MILGGGPAGAAAARLLAQWGHSVQLIARSTARARMGESLPPSAAKLLDRVGMLDVVERAAFVRSTGNTVQWGTSASRAEYFPGGTLGWQLERDVFDRVLLESAKDAGASVIEHASAREISDVAEDGTREVVYDGDARGRVRAQWILDCTGRAGLVARRGWRRQEQTARTIAIIGVWNPKTHWEIADDTHTVVESYADGWAWSIPVSARDRYVTVMVDPARTSLGTGLELKATYLNAIADTVAMRSLIAQGTLVGDVWAREASPYGFTDVGERGVLLVGDAASFVDPLSSFGIKKALASAWMAAVVTHSALRTTAVLSPALDLYERREREMHTELQRQAALLARDAVDLHASEFWSDRAIHDSSATGELPGDTQRAREAFDTIRRRHAIRLEPSPSLRSVPKAMVVGNEIAMVPHLTTDAVPEGLRFVRNVDVAHLSRIADGFDQVPDLYEAYNRTQSRVELSDFLAALSTLVGNGMLRLLDMPAHEP